MEQLYDRSPWSGRWFFKYLDLSFWDLYIISAAMICCPPQEFHVTPCPTTAVHLSTPRRHIYKLDSIVTHAESPTAPDRDVGPPSHPNTTTTNTHLPQVLLKAPNLCDKTQVII